jgi:hypothetical protein
MLPELGVCGGVDLSWQQQPSGNSLTVFLCRLLEQATPTDLQDVSVHWACHSCG